MLELGLMPVVTTLGWVGDCHDARQVEKVAARGLASQDTRPGLPSSPNHTSGEPEEADQPAGKVLALTLSLRNSHMYLLLLLILLFLLLLSPLLSCLPLSYSPGMSASRLADHFWQIFKWDQMWRRLCLVDCLLIDFNSGAQSMTHSISGNIGNKRGSTYQNEILGHIFAFCTTLSY